MSVRSVTGAMFGIVLVGATAACAGAAPAPQTAAGQAPEPESLAAPAADEQSPKASLAPAPRAVPAPATLCEAFVQQQPACADAGQADWKAGLSAALAVEDPLQRDALLAGLEACEVIEPALVRALRADLAPAECGEALVLPVLEQARDVSLQHTLKGLALASRLARLAQNAPAPSAEPKNKAEAMQFFREVFAPWVRAQAQAIFDTMTLGVRLDGYGKGLVAVEAGMADMRFVRMARALPLPAEMASDQEVREVYYAALDEALEPYKIRGRDAALVGLRVFRDLGVITDGRLSALRELLSETYGGRRIDALDGLLLPPDAPTRAEVGSPQAALARLLPTYYSPFVFSADELKSPELLGAWAARGFPEISQRHFQRAALDSRQAALVSALLFRLGQLYWRAADFARAAQMLETGHQPAAGDAGALNLSKALASALAKGPKDAAVMMIQGPTYPAGIGNVSALDAIASGTGPHAATAAFNAGHLLSIVTPQAEAIAHFRGVAERFDRAAALFRDPALKARATQRAREARETLAAIERLEGSSKPSSHQLQGRESRASSLFAARSAVSP